jgi:hypothetical protein
MIHLHSSLFPSEINTSTSGQSSSPLAGESKLDSFHGALSDAVSSTKGPITRASADAATTVSTSSGTSTRTAPPTPGTVASNASPSTTSSGAPDNGYDPFLQAAYNNPFANAAVQTSTRSSIESAAAPLTAQQVFDNTYWASQPAAVQPLRTMQNQAERSALASQLASEGYSIDVPIMVWGWDPSTTMSMRESEGYSWVPSALQNPVEDAPGLAAAGTVAAYDPSNTPSGSIAV